MVKTLQIWKDGVNFMEKGNYEEALTNFMALEGRTDSSQQLITSGRNLFNIGQMYRGLDRMEMATKSFEESIEKDKMSAVTHFLLGNTNLALNRNDEALKNFNDAHFFLRGNKLITYYPLGLKAKLYLCEILVNRAIAQSRLADTQEAKSDFLKALQAKVEPRHRAIDDFLDSWESGKEVEPYDLPSRVVYQPQKRQIDAISMKQNIVGHSKVVVEREMTRFPDSRLESTKTSPRSPTNPSKDLGDEQRLEQHQPAAKQAVSKGLALSKEIQEKESNSVLKEVSTEAKAEKNLSPGHLQNPVSPGQSQASPGDSSTGGGKIGNRSPFTQRKKMVSSSPKTPSWSSNEVDAPPTKPLPPAPKSRNSDLTQQSSNKTRDITLVLTRTVKVDQSASTQDLLTAAANTFQLSKDSFALWCMKNTKLSVLQDQDLEEILQSPLESAPKVYCYLNKPK